MLPFRTLLLLTLLSGLCWWLSFDLHLHWWWPIWLAPAPVLYIAPKVNKKQAFAVAFIALLIGRLSWLGFLLKVLPPAPAILYTLLFPLLYAAIILLVRYIILNRRPWMGLFALPVLWTSFEFLFSLISPDGTIASFAYTQCDMLPVMQLASVTGFTGITFFICLFPSVLVQTLTKKTFLLFSLLIIIPLAFGILRMSNPGDKPAVTVGLISLPENIHERVDHPLAKNELEIASLYNREARDLAGQGATLILLPEKVISVTDSTDSLVTKAFQQTAHDAGVTLIAGYARINPAYSANTGPNTNTSPHANTASTPGHLNQARVFSPNGALQVNYEKVNLFEGEILDGFKAGKTPGLFNLYPAPSTTPPSSTVAPPTRAGVAICKDMDFARFMHSYKDLGIVLVPAWDFDDDGWWHSRIAITRSIENGYALVRNARQGRLTISDDKGRVLAEANTEKGNKAILLGKISPNDSTTIYSRWGDWFGWLSLLFVLIIHLPWRRSPSSAPHNAHRSPDH